jgi:YidC/Oxa1 family membrane protein insertase
MIRIYELILYNPILNVLVFFYNTVAFGDLGLAIIFSTVLVRIILFPLFQRGAKNQAIMQRLQPKLDKIKKDHKKDWEKQSQAMMQVYKEHNINPFSGFLFLLLQIPILITLYHIFLNIFSPTILNNVYSFVHKPEFLNTDLFGLINLGEKSIIMVVLAAIVQYYQAKMMVPSKASGESLSAQEKIARNMVFVGPIITLVILYNLPAAVSLYWLTTSLFSILQQLLINKELNNGKLGDIYQKTA